MGEAKRRKAADPTYGKPRTANPTQGMQKKGLIISPPMEIEGGTLRLKSVHIDSQELKAALLFWDKLIWPSSRSLHIGSGPDERFLEAEGILARPDYTHDGDVAFGMARSYAQAFTEMNDREPGHWAMMHGEKSLLLKGARLPEHAGTALELQKAIPVPDKDVPLTEILEFKYKRYDELLSLRTQIDSFIASVDAAEDREMELRKRFSEIDEACVGVLRVCAEWQFPVRLSSLKANVELRPFQTLAGALTAFGFAQAQALPLSQQVLAGMVGAAIATAPALKISTDIGWLGLHKPSSPFRYVSSYHREVF